ncbi:nucleoside-diphosphate-sugar epimerase [Brevundimonas nasdae]|nr:nucleoside-diphosphate-sugar epimerase [Brevundimonas nasdae]
MGTPIIVTGAAGFIGMHTAERLLDRGETVIGVDVLNDYYDPALKEARAARLEGREGFRMVRADIADHEQMKVLVADAGATYADVKAECPDRLPAQDSAEGRLFIVGQAVVGL